MHASRDLDRCKLLDSWLIRKSSFVVLQFINNYIKLLGKSVY